jgi:hypothetical protein
LIEKLLTQREALSKSVLAAIRFIPKYMDWKDVVLPLFRKFTDFIDIVPELLTLIRFNQCFFKSICEIFATDALCESFTRFWSSQQTVALKFFQLLIGSDVGFTLTDDLRRHVNRLVHNAADRKATEPIRGYLSMSPNHRGVLVAICLGSMVPWQKNMGTRWDEVEAIVEVVEVSEWCSGGTVNLRSRRSIRARASWLQ